jgi:hypothetical protein
MRQLLFLDIEASGFGEESYPIEVAWGRPCTGSVEEYLIRPLPDWTHWDPKAEKIHGIDRELLLAQGSNPVLVAERATDVIADMIVCSDASRFDSFWLHRLLVLAAVPARIELSSTDILWDVIARHRFPEDDTPNSMAGAERQDAWIKSIKAKARVAAPIVHRAAADVRNLLAICRLALDGIDPETIDLADLLQA